LGLFAAHLEQQAPSRVVMKSQQGDGRFLARCLVSTLFLAFECDINAWTRIVDLEPITVGILLCVLSETRQNATKKSKHTPESYFRFPHLNLGSSGAKTQKKLRLRRDNKIRRQDSRFSKAAAVFFPFDEDGE
jgi:hypothetical protein